MSVFRFLLFPLALIYDWITKFRNHLYDIDYKHAIEFDRIVISVGNLNVGGSGKSPMIEYLIRLLRPQFKVATLSRGYGRKTRGFRLASEEDTARTLGDEPFQFYLKFKNEITVTVGEERAMAIPEMLMEKPETEIILLDDAYQHRPVKPTFSILLTDYSKPFYTDFVLPMGTLREARKGVRRADVVVVTKCPLDISDLTRKEMTSAIRNYANKPVFFSAIKYGNPLPLTNLPLQQSSRLILVSGIANSGGFESHVRTLYSVDHHFDFADHHNYTQEEVRQIEEKATTLGSGTAIITTEKDMVKLIAFRESMSFPWHYIPIETIFIENGPEFDARLLQTTKS